MLHYAVVFFVIALIAALFGFGGIAAGAAEIAKVLFFIFVVLFVISLIVGWSVDADDTACPRRIESAAWSAMNLRTSVASPASSRPRIRRRPRGTAGDRHTRAVSGSERPTGRWSTAAGTRISAPAIRQRDVHRSRGRTSGRDLSSDDDARLVPAIFAWDPDVRFVYYRHVSKWM